MTNAVREFWNQRASLGNAAGTDDLIAWELEARAIGQYVRNGMRVLDAGCGNGRTLLRLAKSRVVVGRGIDFSAEMISAAWKALPPDIDVAFSVADLREPLGTDGGFDLIYTQRALINLASWEEQRGAILRLLGLLREGGTFVMCENSQDGLDDLNNWRSSVGLAAIVAPWHNRYLRDAEVKELAEDPHGCLLVRTEYPLSTYAFLSRVVNAVMSKDAGHNAPDYDAPVNHLALRLPAFPFPFGQNRLWVWRKAGGE